MIINIRPVGGNVYNNKTQHNANLSNQSSSKLNKDVFLQQNSSYSDKAKVQDSTKLKQ